MSAFLVTLFCINTGEIDATESLFYYEPGKDHESHTDRTYTPVFEPVANPFC